jgi:glycosyltransferase involved in cell wall biosynthesis
MTKRTPGVSVLMPSYNCARYLPLAIGGVLSQSYSDLELIIIDDCSTDGSREVAAEWSRSDDRVVTVFHDKNRGLSAARNTALASSSGTVIALCDADDIWSPEKLGTQVEQLRKHPEVGVIHSDSLIIDADGTPTGQRFSSLLHGRHQKCSGELYNELCLRNFICNSTVVLRRECLEYAEGFDERLRSLEDWVCWARIAKEYLFCYIEDVLIRYRVHQTSLSMNEGAMARNRVAAIRLMLDEFKDVPGRTKSRMLYTMAMSHWSMGDSRSAFREFKESAVADPLHYRSWARCLQILLASPAGGIHGANGRG